MTRLLKYEKDGDIFKSATNFGSDLIVHHRRRGVVNSAYSSISNSYCVTSFNVMHNMHGQGDSLSQTSLTIFDLESWEVVHRITQSNTAVNMSTNTLSVTQHPKYDRVCVTSDLEGQVVFWDCMLGCALRIFVEHASIIGQPLEANSVTDCNFSKCGNFLVVGTNYGSFSVYGYGGSDHFEHVDIEQFRSDDYIETSLHPETFAIISNDTGFDINGPDHVDDSFACNLNMVAHSVLGGKKTFDEVREWIEDRVNSQKYRLQEMKKIDESSLRETRDVEIRERKRVEDAIRAMAESVNKNRVRESRVEGETVENVHLHNGLTHTNTQSLDQMRSSSNARTQERDRPELIDAPDLSDEDRRPRRLRRARVSESSISEKDLEEEDQEEDIDDDLIDDEDNVRRRRSARISKLRAEIRPRRREARTTGMSLRSRRHHEEGRLGKRDIIDEDDADSEEFYQGFGRSRKVDKAKETPVVEEELFCSRCLKVGAREKCQGEDETCQNVYHHYCSDMCGTDVKDQFMCFDCLLTYYERRPSQFDYSKNELDDHWLDMQIYDPDFIAPQIGDKFYFVFQAYEMFVSNYFELLNIKKGDLFWPWRKNPLFLEKEVKCEIIEIEYEFPALRGKKIQNEFKNFLTVIMRIKLKIIDNMFESSIGEDDNTFEVKYFPVNDLPSFFVWHQIYEKRVREYHHAILHSEIKHQNSYYSIREKTCLEESFPNTLFHCIKARPKLGNIATRRRYNDAEGTTLFSPWEVEFMNVVIKPRKGEEFVQLEEPEEFRLPEQVVARFIHFMRHNAKHCGPFIHEVDKTRYSDYTEYIKVEMYLMKLYNRVQNNYYRSVPAFLHDIELISTNAKYYNDSRSLIVQQAKLLVDYLRALVLDERKGRDIEKLLRQLQTMNMTDNSFDVDKDSAVVKLSDKSSKQAESLLSEESPPPVRPTRRRFVSDEKDEDHVEQNEDDEDGEVNESNMNTKILNRRERHQLRLRRTQPSPVKSINRMGLRHRR